MTTSELIEKELSAMPERLQREVYDFARFLNLRSKGELQLVEELAAWEAASDEDMLKFDREMAEAQ